MSVRSPYFTRLRGSSGGASNGLLGKKRISQQKPRPEAKSGSRTNNVKEEPKLFVEESAHNERIKSPSKKIKLEPKEILDDHAFMVKTKWEPIHWREHLENIRKMREERNAPVDTMGCEKCKGDDYSEKDKRFHTLVSLMLSSQTKDHITHGAMLKLLDYGLSADSILEISDAQLGELIYPVGFWKKKIVYLKKTAAVLKQEYNGDIPNTVEELVKLPGVGPKMAYLAMTCAWDKVVGIGVDVHVHRISNRLKWVRKTTSEPEKTRKELEDWLPQSYWREVNWLLVGFGQQICLPVSPRCSDCLNKDICPASSSKSRKIKAQH